MMQTLLNTLYLTTSGAYLHLDNDTARIEVERETKLRVPLHHLSAVVCYGNIMISPAMMHRLADEGKSLVLLDRNGRFKARLEGKVNGNILLRQAQFRKMDNADFVLDLAKTIVAGKLKNTRYVLLRGARDANNESDGEALRGVASHLASNLQLLPKAADLDGVRGLEGDSARRYFSVFKHLIRIDRRDVFTPNGRTRRPPLDRMNALLSFLYSLTMNDCRSALEGVGLDPQYGALHAVRPGRAALALDLMEEFRPLYADRLALTLINRGQLNPDDFEERTGGAVQLKEEARKILLNAYQERKQEEVSHPLLQNRLLFGLLPHIQARLLARVIRGEAEGYLPYWVR
jgi:CRISP-associated protein Cas1